MNINTYPNPWDLRYFQEVAATENFSRAAERLGVGQPALSLSIKRLEEQLQVQLFIRRNRGLKLTESGVRLLKECNRLLSDWAAVVSEVQKSQTELVGRYRLGCHAAVALYALNPLIRDLYSAYSGLEVELVHGLSRVICERVVSNEIDFGIVINPVRHPDLIISEMAKDKVGFWVAPGGLEEVIIYNPDLMQSQALLKNSNRTFERSLTSDSLEVIALLAKSGAGVAILPERVKAALAPGLKPVPNQPSFQDRITLVYRADLRKTAGATAIIQAIKKLSL